MLFIREVESMSKTINGFEALVEAALLAGCRAVYACRSVPGDEIAGQAAMWMPRVGGAVFHPTTEEAVLENAFLCAREGSRVLLSSTGIRTGVLREGLARFAAAEVPCVVAHTIRAGSGILYPSAADYIQLRHVPDHHEGLHCMVLAPDGVEEILRLTTHAWGLAERYRNPVVLLLDETLGRMTEPVTLPESQAVIPETPLVSSAESEIRSSLSWDFFQEAILEAQRERLQEKYAKLESRECKCEEYYTDDDPSNLVIAYGEASRTVRKAVELARSRGMRVGMFRPVSLYPFPSQRLRALARRVASILVVELGRGQLLESVQQATGGLVFLRLISASESFPPTAGDILAVIGRTNLKYAS